MHNLNGEVVRVLSLKTIFTRLYSLKNLGQMKLSDRLYQLICRDKTSGVSSEPAKRSRNNCQRMFDFDSFQFILIRMAYITDRLVSICARSNVTFDIGLDFIFEAA